MSRRVLVGLVFTSAAFAQITAELTRKTSEVFAAYDEPGSPGCAVSVIRNGRPVFQKGYGYANLDYGIPITPATVFHVASVSKQFTAAAILLLEQDGKLSIDDEIHKYIPELMSFGAPVTLRHLLYHTSGIRDQWHLLNISGWRYSRDLITDDDVLLVLSRQRDLNFEPGSEHMYSNSGYTLLALVVKRVSGQSLREFTSKRIFGPLGMKNTFFRDEFREVVKNLATGYSPEKSAFQSSVTNFDTTGATSLLTTVEGLAAWERNFIDPKVGGREFLVRFTQPGTLAGGKPIDYGMGLVSGKYRGLTTIVHGGSDAGYRAVFMRFPEQQFAVACLCNIETANPGDLARRVADIHLRDQFREPRSDPPKPPSSPNQATWNPTPAELAEFPGIYRSSEIEAPYRIRSEAGKLIVQGPKSDLAGMDPLEKDLFRAGPARLRFRRAASGAVNGFALNTDRIRNLIFQRASAPHVVLVAADDEYRSEHSLPMLARILEAQHGIRTTVPRAFPAPGNNNNIRGLEALDDADLAVFYMQWRELPEEQVRLIERYAASGKPMVGFRTTTHSFRYPKDSPHAELNDGFGRDIFGQRWIRHHGHRSTTDVTAAEGASGHPVMRGVATPFSVPSWLYEVSPLVGDATPLLTGRAVNPEGRDASPQPVAWVKTYRGARVFFTTLGHPDDFKNENVRRLALNGILWALGRDVPEGGASAAIVGSYIPPDSGILPKK